MFPQAREGRCWFHKTANVLAALPKSAHPGAKIVFVRNRTAGLLPSGPG